MDTITKRIDNVTEIPEEYRQTILPPPPSVKVELTSRCNHACKYCAHGRGYSKKQWSDMDFELFKRIAKQIRDAGVEELGVFYIGESTLYPRLVDAVKYAKQIGFPYVFLTTNGVLMTEKKARELMEAGLDSLKFSVNYFTPQQYWTLTGMAFSVFDRIVENIKKTYEVREEGNYKTRLYASSIMYWDPTMYDSEYQEAEKFLDEHIRPYVDEHYWLPLLSFGDSPTQTRVNGGQAMVGNPGRLGNMRPPLPCWAVFREGHVTHDGKLTACCFDASDSWVMADLKEVDFMKGWNSEEFQKLREAHLKGNVRGTPCERCIYG